MTNLFKDRQLQQRTLIFIRWMAICGQLAAILAVTFIFGYYLPLAWCLATVGALALVNLIANIRRSRPFVSDKVAAAYLSFDMIQLGFLLYLTGGINNPFSILMLSPITVSATILSKKVTASRVSGFGINCNFIFCSFEIADWWGNHSSTAHLLLGVINGPLFIIGFYCRVSDRCFSRFQPPIQSFA